MNRLQACLGVFLGLSMLAVAGRLTIRIKTRHKLYVDDAFLCFGLICMCVATGLAYSTVSIVYLQEAAIFEPERYSFPPGNAAKFIENLVIVDLFVVFAWTAEFSVKVSLLLFFRLLVKRLKRLTRYVDLVLGITIVVWAVLVCEPFITCPHYVLSDLSECPRYLFILKPSC